MVPRTCGMSRSTVTELSRSRSEGSQVDPENTGPMPLWKAKSMPMAAGGTRMSLKTMEASNLKRQKGCSVTSAASSGLRQSPKIRGVSNRMVLGEITAGLTHEPNRWPLYRLRCQGSQK